MEKSESKKQNLQSKIQKELPDYSDKMGFALHLFEHLQKDEIDLKQYKSMVKKLYNQDDIKIMSHQTKFLIITYSALLNMTDNNIHQLIRNAIKLYNESNCNNSKVNLLDHVNVNDPLHNNPA